MASWCRVARAIRAVFNSSFLENLENCSNYSKEDDEQEDVDPFEEEEEVPSSLFTRGRLFRSVCKGEEDTARVSAALPLHKFRELSRINYFPQYVMHVDVFFSIYREDTARFRSWRQLLDMSLIMIMDVETQKERNAEILFISHEWASRSHPDPQGIQLRCLYDTLKRMSNGDFSKYGTSVQSFFREHWSKNVRLRVYASLRL